VTADDDPREVAFSAPDARAMRATLHRIAEHFHTRREPASKSTRVYYDTFDWRVHRAGGTLAVEQTSSSRALIWSRSAETLRSALPGGRTPCFARDLEHLPFGPELARVLDVRRLLPVARVEVLRETHAVLDGREKTVARIHLDRGKAGPGDAAGATLPMPERLRIAPLLGYGDDHRRVVQLVETAPTLSRRGDDELTAALETLGRRAGDYSSRIDVSLDPGMRTESAVREILRHLFATLRANEDGTRRDLDTEFLHDFRVATRRTRSCLGQVKGVFDPGDRDRFRAEFAWLGSVTGPTRDLDVYLLNLPQYRGGLPDSLRPGIDDLEVHLRKRQRVEQRRVARALASRRYAKLVRDWAAFLDRPQPDGQARPDAARPVRDVAARRILAAFGRVCKRGRGLTPGASATTVHRLRIDCKKLRYLLEFFQSVFDQERVTPFVRSLKRLQDHLGEYNDLEVQQHDLRGSASQMLAGGRVSVDTLLALGCLVGGLERRQVELRRLLDDSVRAFVGDENSAGLLELFG